MFDGRGATQARLIDYGALGQRSRFEAFRTEGSAQHTHCIDPAAARALVDDIVEFLDALAPCGRRWLELGTPDGAGTAAMLRLVAREARLKGFVPIAAQVIERFERDGRLAPWRDGLVSELEGRTIVLLDSGWLGSSNPVGEQFHVGARSVLALGAAGPRAIVAVISMSDRTVRTSAMVLAREQSPEFSSGDARLERPWPTGAVQPVGPDHSPLILARELGERGRHEAAARAFREALARFDRRGEVLPAAEAWYELGHLRRRRGATADAGRAFREAGQRYRAAGATTQAIAAAANEGLARIEAGELAVAERILQAASTAAEQLPTCGERLLADAALITCLDWQRKSDAASRLVAQGALRHDTAVEATSGSGVGAELRVAWHSAAACVALREQSLADASRHTMAALSASRTGPPAVVCQAETLAVRFHGIVGDVEAIRVHAARALSAAKQARAPVEALRLRVVLAASLQRAGAGSEARALAAQLLRRRTPGVPALLRAALGIVVGRLLGDSAVARQRRIEAEGFARTSGAAALLDEADTPGKLPKPFADVIDLLQQTHDRDDEETVLEDVGRLLASRLSARSVSFVAVQDPGADLVTVGSGRGEAAARAAEAGILLGPLRTAAGIEIAAPVRCGGSCVGAVGARWTVSGPDDAGHARTLITTAAALAGPFLRAVVEQRRTAPPAAECPELLGTSLAMAQLRRDVARAAAAPFPVLILGESGVGKELVARAIHRSGPRRLRSLAALNCAALPDELVDAELFGHARGAFTGAVAERRGLFEEADGGTLFLDEVVELSPRAQAKLLRVLQEGEIRRVGESFSRQIDVRIVAASNRQLDGPDAQRRFRQDLRYRLDVIRVEVPPLRHRIEDVPVLATAFWSRVAPLTGCRARLGSATLAALARYDWPGNVRELQNVMSALAAAAPRHGVVGPLLLPRVIANAAAARPRADLDEARQAFERRFVAAALARAGDRKGDAAKALGISRQGLAKLIRRLGIGGRGD